MQEKHVSCRLTVAAQNPKGMQKVYLIAPHLEGGDGVPQEEGGQHHSATQLFPHRRWQHLALAGLHCKLSVSRQDICQMCLLVTLTLDSMRLRGMACEQVQVPWLLPAISGTSGMRARLFRCPSAIEGPSAPTAWCDYIYYGNCMFIIELLAYKGHSRGNQEAHAPP